MSLQEYCCHGTAINGELDQPCLLCEVDSLEQQVAALTEQRDRAEQQVKELLWDDPVEPSFGPAFGDLLMYLNHQTPHPTEIYQMMSNGTKLWQQMKDQVAVLTKERDELEISNAFAHGEWRAVKDQLAAALAREAKLRDAAKAVLEVGMGSDFEALNAAFAIPTDDSALMERLKEERERVALRLIKCGHPKPVIDAIRSMT